jgi:hypothetical protein
MEVEHWTETWREIPVSSDEIRNQGPVRNARSKLGGSSTWLALVEDEDDDENEDDNGKRREARKRGRETWKSVGADASHLYFI